MIDDEILEVVRAHKEGKRIEFRERGDTTWMDVVYPNSIQWNFAVYDFRVAPRKPREWWIQEGGMILDYKPLAPLFIHVREVID